jgi:hypothetical protein
MATDPVRAVEALLAQTEAAHGVYETTELHGVYDEAWPQWYASHAVEHGLAAAAGHPIPAEALARFLATSFEDFKGAAPPPSESWAAYTARRVVAEL